MKKFCALLVLVAFAAGSVFAAPAGADAKVAAAVDQVTAVTEVAPATGSGNVAEVAATADEDDLFACVNAVALTQDEAALVEGGDSKRRDTIIALSIWGAGMCVCLYYIISAVM